MPRVAVVAHADKSFGGGLGELKAALTREGFADPLWYEVKKSRKAAKCARRALARCAEVIFIWGGDGTVQRCVDAVAGTGAVIAILPAGTANLLAANLEIPADLTEAVRVGLYGDRRQLGERHACGTGRTAGASSLPKGQGHRRRPLPRIPRTRLRARIRLGALPVEGDERQDLAVDPEGRDA